MTLKKFQKRLASLAVVLLLLGWQVAIPASASANQNTETYNQEQGQEPTSLTAPANDADNSRTTSLWHGQEYGSIKVDKKVDTDGDGSYESGNTTANNLGFDWGLDNETPARNMGTLSGYLATGTHTITENVASGYVFTGWYYTQDEDNYGRHQVNCQYPQGTTQPISVEVKKNKTKEITLCNKVMKGSITIVKDAQPDSTIDFGFNINQDGYGLYDNFALEDDGNIYDGEKNTKTYEHLLADEYVITESSIAGWKLSDISCSEGADVVVNKIHGKATITLHPGENVTCTFVNQKDGKVIVKKHTVPAGDKTNFAIEATTGNGDIYSDPTRLIADGETEWFYVSQGTYTINETLPVGWAQTQNTCVDVVVSADNLYPVCHITNTKQAKLTIIKDAHPDGPQDFTFTSTELGGFTLDDDSDAVLSNKAQFSGLNPGSYAITEQAVAGWDLDDVVCWGTTGYDADLTTGTLAVNLKAGDDVACEFSNVQRNAISGYKFEDVNGNGEWDEGEPTLEGWSITVTNDDATVNETVQTDADGLYSFDNLKLGAYTVCEEAQAGWAQTFPQADDGCHEIYFEGPGQNAYDVNFGNFQLGQVAGAKFNDANGNGKWDTGETTLKNWTISLYQQGQSRDILAMLGTPLQTAKTDDKGTYSFADLLHGDYLVCETQRTGWTRTYPASSDCHELTIDESGQVITADFGNKFVPQVLGASTSVTPAQLVNTGASVTKQMLVGLTVLSILGAAHFLSGRRKDYAQ